MGYSNYQQQEQRVITLDYTPRPIWFETIHPGIESHRFSVIVAHRRFGKSVGSVNHLIKQAADCKLRAPQYAYVAPFQKQAKMIAWGYLKYFTAKIPGAIPNETLSYVEFPSKHENSAGARIYIVGADNPDVLRGTYWDGVVIDEFAQIKKELWGEVIRPALSDRKGWAVFIGTPKGQNQFYEIYQRACRTPSWFVSLYRVDESGVIDQEEIDSMREDMTDTEIRQELMCDFTASAYNILITIDLVDKSIRTKRTPDEIIGSPVILGVDVARFGDDRSVIQRRQGLCAFPARVFSGLNNMELANCVIDEIRRHNVDAVFIDAGRGEGVIDRLHQLGYSMVIEVPFGGKAIKANRYINRRVEMWDAIKNWLEAGGVIPNDPELKTDLTVPEYCFDAANRMKLESKEKIKERFGKSTDLGDALALTFAAPVVPKAEQQDFYGQQEQKPYDIFGMED